MMVKCYFLEDQERRLNEMGEVRMISMKWTDPDELFRQCREAQVICCKKKFLAYERLYDLEDVLIAIPFGKPDFLDDLDRDRLSARRIVVRHSCREYREAVAEWVIYAMISLSRRLHERIRSHEVDIEKNLVMGYSLKGKRVTVLGRGVIGAHLGPICEAFGMEVRFHTRDENILDSVAGADFVVNCLGSKPGDPVILDRGFFSALKQGSYFVSVASPGTYDQVALLERLDDGSIAGAADDVADAHIGDSSDPLYRSLLKSPRMLVTPHIAWRTDFEARASFDKLLDNISQYLEEHQPVRD